MTAMGVFANFSGVVAKGKRDTFCPGMLLVGLLKVNKVILFGGPESYKTRHSQRKTSLWGLFKKL